MKSLEAHKLKWGQFKGKTYVLMKSHVIILKVINIDMYWYAPQKNLYNKSLSKLSWGAFLLRVKEAHATECILNWAAIC